MTIQRIKNGSEITLKVSGRVDTNTSPQLQQEILGAFQGVSRLILDLEDVAYISSAGLRALLIGQKTAASKKAEFALVHVQPAVLSILDSVGFSKILTIK